MKQAHNWKSQLVCRVLAGALIALFVVSCRKSPAFVPTEIPGDSIYQIDSSWTDQDQKTVQIRSFAGKPVVAAFFFSKCRSVCPRIVADIRKIESLIDAQDRRKVSFLMVSLDVKNDNPARLKSFERQNKIQGWTLLTGSENDIRTLTALLNIRYERQENGEFNHSSSIILLDPQGRIAHTEAGLKDAGKSFLVRLDDFL